MDNFDASVHLGEGGTFTDQFYTDLPTGLGTDYEGKDMSETFRRAGNMGQIIKNGLQHKSALDSKMEGVIQKPGDGASAEVTEAYRATLATELGLPQAPETVDGYTLAGPEGVTLDAGGVDDYKAWCLENKVDPDTAKLFFDMRMGQVAGEEQARQEAADTAFTKGTEQLQADWKGADLQVNLRAAVTALMEFGSEDFEHEGKIHPGLKTAIKNADIYTNPANWDKWKELGITPNNIRVWSAIGKRMMTGPGGDLSTNPNLTADEQARAAHVKAVNAMSALSPDLQLKE